jgi:hypothetical protein
MEIHRGPREEKRIGRIGRREGAPVFEGWIIPRIGAICGF